MMNYDVDRNWLSPGFNLSYGTFDFYNPAGGYLMGVLTTPGGTRHRMRHLGIYNGANVFEEDGTSLRYVMNYSGGFPAGGVLFNTDGSIVSYGATVFISSLGASRSFAQSITDRHGNLTQVSYVTGMQTGEIDFIKETMNRYVRFKYEGTGTARKLVTITIPAYNDTITSEKQIARFYYADINVNPTGSFSVESDIVGTKKVLKYVYFPTTNGGYRFNYSEPYGTIREIQQLRGMTISTTDVTQTGTVMSDGQVAASSVYNYPTTAINLDNAPKYSTRTDDWAGRTSTQPVYYFSANEGDGTSSVTAPDGTVTRTYTIVAQPGAWNNGLIDRVELKASALPTAQTLGKTVYTWQQGAIWYVFRLEKLEYTNEANQTRAVLYGDYDTYNNARRISEHDFAPAGTVGTELRRTETTFETGSGWINNNLVSLPKTVKIIANNTVVSRIDYEYDNNGADATQNLAQRDDLVMFDPSRNPFEPPIPAEPGCVIDGVPCPPIPVYYPPSRFRGNITKITTYANAALGESDPNKSVRTIKYDVPGNVVEETSSCCFKRTFSYNKAFEYAYPVSSSQGSAGQLTTSMTFDYNTGFVKTVTDENNQKTTYTYDTVSLRQTRVDKPDGGYTTFEYNDTLIQNPDSSHLSSFIKTTTALDSNRTVSSWKYFDGRGATVRTFGALTSQGHVGVTDIEYDEMGRVKRTSNPYYASGPTAAINPSNKWTGVTYDLLGRAITITLPDNNTIQTAYNGITTTTTDQAGKQRRQLTDALGRVIRVDEPDANGNLGDVSTPNQPTLYEYDPLNNLTKVTQSSGSITQERLFKYDSLSRLTHERQVEAIATLNDAGQKQTSGGLWTGVYVYNTDGLLKEGYDARGVKTALTYDGLNRVSQVLFAGETNYQTPTITYTYDEERSGYFNKGRLTKVETASTTAAPTTSQIYDYDKMGRVAKQQQTIGANGSIASQTYTLEYHYNFAGQLISGKYPSGRQVAYAVDEAGRLSNVFGGGRTYASGFNYAGHSSLTSMTYGNGATESFSYNDRTQITQQSLEKNNFVIQRYDYAYGEVDLSTGNVLTNKNTGQLARVDGYIGGTPSSPTKQWQQRFSYDSIGRLEKAKEVRGDNSSLMWESKFSYDRWGNRYRKLNENPDSLLFIAVEETNIDKTTNRIATNTSYDEAGNTISDSKFRNMNYRYDANGRLVWSQTISGTTTSTAVYNALGQRIATQVGGQWRYMIYDIGGKIVAEYGQISNSTEKVKYIMLDRQGSTRTILNQSGSALSRFDYQPFGEEIGAGIGQRTSGQGYSVSEPTRQKYALTERDEATGLDHTWFRKYENLAGRWTSPDPYKGAMKLSNPQSFNRYSYVRNDPENYIDPNGLIEILCELWSWYDFITGEEVGPRFFVCFYRFSPQNNFMPIPAPNGGNTRLDPKNDSDNKKYTDYTNCVQNKLAILNRDYEATAANIQNNLSIKLLATTAGVGAVTGLAVTIETGPGAIIGAVFGAIIATVAAYATAINDMRLQQQLFVNRGSDAYEQCAKETGVTL